MKRHIKRFICAALALCGALTLLCMTAAAAPDDCAVIFDLQGGEGNETTADQPASRGGKVDRPAIDPTKEGFAIVGWYTEPEGDNEWDFDIYTFPLDIEALTLYAKWAPALERENHIIYLYGYPDGSMKPGGDVSRAEVAAIFHRLIIAGDREMPLAAASPDVSDTDWFYQEVAYLEEYGIIKGYPDGTFRPADPITRAEFATIASRFDKMEAGAPGVFPDVTDTHWAALYINNAAAKGWVNRIGIFRPNDFITREEVAVFVNRMLGRGIESADIPADVGAYADLSPDRWSYCDIIEASVAHEYIRKANGYEIWI